jgi:predicted component of type VI protein secretion system
VTDISTETPADDEPEGDESPVIAQLRKDAKEGKAAIKKLEALERERAFDKAGVPDDGVGKWFRKGYDGEIDVDSIRQAAVTDGLIAASDGPDPQEAAEAAQAAGLISEASAASQSNPTIDALMRGASSMDEIEQIAKDAGVSVPIR